MLFHWHHNGYKLITRINNSRHVEILRLGESTREPELFRMSFHHQCYAVQQLAPSSSSYQSTPIEHDHQVNLNRARQNGARVALVSAGAAKVAKVASAEEANGVGSVGTPPLGSRCSRQGDSAELRQQPNQHVAVAVAGACASLLAPACVAQQCLALNVETVPHWQPCRCSDDCRKPLAVGLAKRVWPALGCGAPPNAHHTLLHWDAPSDPFPASHHRATLPYI